MKSEHGEIILASASPRRSELMTLAGISFRVFPAHICEAPLPNELPVDHVLRLSREKAQAVSAKSAGRVFVAADTIVVLDGAIFGKPVDNIDAVRMLTALSNREHEVITGFTVLDKKSGTVISRTVTTKVLFKELSRGEIFSYIATGCPMDKAGAYAMQGGAVHFVRSINGSFSNVIGLPMTELYEALQELNKVAE